MKLCMLLLLASPLVSALVVPRAAPTAVLAPTKMLARSCDVAAAQVRTQQRAAVVMMGRHAAPLSTRRATRQPPRVSGQAPRGYG